ncbi:subtilisin-related protease [Xylariales sp. AK1849]|nr:subtilisin-related protease [Xylariales sp. AK1849]
MRSSKLLSVLGALLVLPITLAAGDDVIPGSYIVTMKRDVKAKDFDNHVNWVNMMSLSALSRRRTDSGDDDIPLGITSQFSIGPSWNGYAGHFDDATLASIRAAQTVAYVEPNQYVHLHGEIEEQTGSTWGLDLLSHNSTRPPRDNPHPENFSYLHDPQAGRDMWAYVIDTGVRVTHEDFGGRAFLGYDVHGSRYEHTDGDGHGTHVAGTIAGSRYGVCKQCKIMSVKMFGIPGQRTTAGTLLKSLEWATKNITDEGRQDRAVINISAGGRKMQATNDAVKSAWEAGVITVVSAGNRGLDADIESPASAPEAVTVGSVTSIPHGIARSSWSNQGPVVDIFAPGRLVESLGKENDTESGVIKSGTSMAAPHVSGLILYIKSVFGGLEKAADAVPKLKELARAGVVDDVRRAPNLLAYNGAEDAAVRTV